MKRGQITIFIILGGVILISLAFIFYLRGVSIKKLQPEIQQTLSSSQISSNIKTYVESCINIVSEPLIESIAKHGGYFNPSSNIFYNNQELNIFCKEENNKGCVNAFVLRQEIEKDLSEKIRNELNACINFSVYTEQGLKISKGNITITTNIGSEDIQVNVDYPIEVSIKDSKVNIKDFSKLIKFPLGVLYSLAIDITNSEIDKGYFDKDEWMINHGAAILIEKHKPYPDTVYILTKKDTEQKKDFIFQFAVKGLQTVGKEIIKKPIISSGCCINSEDNFCFKNVPKDMCKNNYNSSLDCSCKEAMKEIHKDSRENKDCSSAYIYPAQDFKGTPKKHGESWCVYDSAVGRGLDYVGTRHYLHSCIDGMEIVEECRDFREELCTEKVISKEGKDYSKAICRLNRWYDCALQNDKISCQDENFRDCFWLENRLLNRQTRCVPFVPPGFKFWEGNGQDICSYASENPSDSMRRKSPRTWSYSTLQFCQRMGDCGNYRNVVDELTEFGYFNPLGNAEPWVYLEPGYANQGNHFVIYLPLEKNSLKDSTSIPKGPLGSYAKCNLWKAPISSDKCSLCNKIKNKPCTEYKCKSLGQQCMFRIESGNPTCIKSGVVKTTQLEIEFDDPVLSSGFTLKKGHNEYFDAFENNIIPELNPYEPLTFGITTSKPARCKLSLRPSNVGLNLWQNDQILSSLPEVWFGDNFKIKHNITLRFPDKSLNNLNQYQLFVSCQDEYGNKNEDKFFVRVTTKDPATYILPSIIDINPKELKVSNQLEDIELFVNKPFKECRYSKNNAVYENMIKINCNAAIQDITYTPSTPLGSFICDAKILLDSPSYYFNCKDWSGSIPTNNFKLNII